MSPRFGFNNTFNKTPWRNKFNTKKNHASGPNLSLGKLKKKKKKNINILEIPIIEAFWVLTSHIPLHQWLGSLKGLNNCGLANNVKYSLEPVFWNILSYLTLIKLDFLSLNKYKKKKIKIKNNKYGVIRKVASSNFIRDFKRESELF